MFDKFAHKLVTIFVLSHSKTFLYTKRTTRSRNLSNFSILLHKHCLSTVLNCILDNSFKSESYTGESQYLFSEIFLAFIKSLALERSQILMGDSVFKENPNSQMQSCVNLFTLIKRVKCSKNKWKYF